MSLSLLPDGGEGEGAWYRRELGERHIYMREERDTGGREWVSRGWKLLMGWGGC